MGGGGGSRGWAWAWGWLAQMAVLDAWFWVAALAVGKTRLNSTLFQKAPLTTNVRPCEPPRVLHTLVKSLLSRAVEQIHEM